MKVRQHTRRVILHYTATPLGREVTVEEVRRWHKGRGWSDIGYHYLIDAGGVINIGRPLRFVGAHTKGQNYDSIGICYVGGLDQEGNDTMTVCQAEAIRYLFDSLQVAYGPLTLHAHREFKNTACPGFDVKDRFNDAL
ncbi:MAG: putative endolysin [Prokaryotic dsDNA virus sp.]|nr:MAG: putative endolysin [Prokaryotic dsDNA virus sp.]|tara:strand:+ start:4942 stop:5355 length:414 start_codon:yes stop_codon:yes gene_type:complete